MAREQEPLNGVAALYKARLLAGQGIAPCDQQFEERWPHLFSLLSNNKVSRDKFTLPVRLGVYNACGDWCLSLSAPGLAMYGEQLYKTFLEGLDGLTAAIAAQTFPWKPNPARALKVKEIEKPKS